MPITLTERIIGVIFFLIIFILVSEYAFGTALNNEFNKYKPNKKLYGIEVEWNHLLILMGFCNRYYNVLSKNPNAKFTVSS